VDSRRTGVSISDRGTKLVPLFTRGVQSGCATDRAFCPVVARCSFPVVKAAGL